MWPRLRLHGIDAPESVQSCKDEDGRTWSCGDAATDALRTFIGGSEIECRQTGTGRYGRIVAICYKDGIDINAWLERVSLEWKGALSASRAREVLAGDRLNTLKTHISLHFCLACTAIYPLPPMLAVTDSSRSRV